ncbi:alpha/beta hydrolase [Streptococcus loxodontisalivarius]|uniref:Pimeloyl-ACP methyl ester carboxylesterase n=1 Tax=Streptococcus loxodontisalivarius TaxID=1349415 RepID=A0ABS2PQW2_9STRE|nr:alpha/beta hydrolase [Streptococcus loxodontisalivarius]MBM7642434.1 pimeloyl-ACP methyl ester carboxylesterase [Streptococcus loxodontisalivarius]
MKKIYFLDGLGSNRYYCQKFKDVLSKAGFDLIYLEYDTNDISDENYFISWFEENISEEKIILMGFSIGADLANALAYLTNRVSQLILLDGGLNVHAIDQMSLDDEINENISYLQHNQFQSLNELISEEITSSPKSADIIEKAVRESYFWDENKKVYKLKITEDYLNNLLRLRRYFYTKNSQIHLNQPILLCLSGQPEEYYRDKLLRLEQFKDDNFYLTTFENASHQIYLEEVDALVETIEYFVRTT